MNFPKRNRIISGMSLGTILVETDVNGGAMITAGTALDQNREVFAGPGKCSGEEEPGDKQVNKRGGRQSIVENVSDVIDELRYKLKPILKSVPKSSIKIQLTIFEQKVFDLLTDEPSHIDALSERGNDNL